MDYSEKPFNEFIPYTLSKPWGYEYVYIKTDNYVGKVLHINEGHRISLQYHKNKTETLYVIKGRCEIFLVNETNLLDEGSFIHIEPGEVHRVKAISECRIIEISTPQLDDIVRLDDDYSRC